MPPRERGPRAYERQFAEPVGAYKAFCIYRDMEHQRSSLETAKQSGYSHNTIRVYMTKYNWVERAAAYDDHIEAEVRLARRRDIINARLKQAKTANTFIDKIVARLQSLDPDDIAVHNLPQFFDTAVKVQRLALGMATDSIEVNEGRENDPASSKVAASVFKDPRMVALIDELGERLAQEDTVVTEKPADG